MRRCHLVSLIAVCLLIGCSPAAPLPLPTLAVLPGDTPTPTTTPSPSPSLTASVIPPSATLAHTPIVTPSVTATLTETPSPTASTTPRPTAGPLDVTFKGVYPLEPYLRQPILDALNAERAALPSIEGWTLSAFRAQGDWMKVVLVPTALVESGWEAIEQYAGQWAEVVIQRIQAGQYRAWLIGDGSMEWLRLSVPAAFINLSADLPPLAGAYLFPWEAGQVWWAIQGWHDGNALDFQPAFRQRFTVLASESGRLREICYDGTQSWLEITHADGQATYYLHLTLGRTLRETLLDQNVQRGQPLGTLIYQAPFYSPCGQGGSRHLHFSITDRALLLEGQPLESIAAVASCCNGSPSYISTNGRVEAG
jgi:hypothetical protein